MMNTLIRTALSPSISRVLGAAALVLVLSSLLVGCSTTRSAFGEGVDPCGAPPTNTQQTLSHEAEAEIQAYVSGKTEANNRRRVEQVLSEEGLNCDAMAYRACKVAYAHDASPQEAMDMLRMAYESCRTTGPEEAAKTPEPASPEVGQQPAPVAGDAGGLNIPKDVQDWAPGMFMAQALNNIVPTATKLEARTDIGFDATASCVLGAFLEEGKSVRTVRMFEKNTKYVLFASGSDSVQNVDLILEDPDTGKVLLSDNQPDRTPVLEFTLPQDMKLQVRIKLAASSSGGSFVTMVVMREGGFTIPMTRFRESLVKTLQVAAKASATISQANDQLNGLVFHANNDDFCLFGTIMMAGEAITYGGLNLEGPASLILAGADSASQDVDLEITEQGGGGSWKDTEDDSLPVVIVEPKPGQTYAAKVGKVDRGEPSLITTLVLRAQ